MKKVFLQLALFAVSLAVVSSASAQPRASAEFSRYSLKKTLGTSESGSAGVAIPSQAPILDPLPASITIPGATPVGVGTKYHLQTNRGGLHNIQVDPSNSQRIHAVIMSVPNVTAADTTSAANYPKRNAFYVYSADGGSTWSTPKQVSTLRAGFPTMVLRKNSNNEYVPVIALHHNTAVGNTTDFVTALYMEAGAPGTGNFVGMDADQNLSDGSVGNVIWPSVTLSSDGSKAYVMSAYSAPTTTSSLNNLQFGIFTLTDAGPTAWSGWKSGPAIDNGEGLSTSGTHVLGTMANGNLGVAWIAADYATPQRGIYYETSSDGGNTWGNQHLLWEPQDSATIIPSNTSAFMAPTGLDLVFDKNTPWIAFTAEDRELNAAPTYFPSTGTLGIWSPAYNSGIATVLISRFHWALDTGAFLSMWTRPAVVTVDSPFTDPQGQSNIEYPTLAHIGTGSGFALYFQTWANQDVERVRDTLNYLYQSIYRDVTHDRGGTWTISPVASNDPLSEGQKIDYRYPEVSSFIPVTGTNAKVPILFGADTAAGASGFSGAGLPGWDVMDWYFRNDTLNTAGEAVHGTEPTVMSLEQNYPNPVRGETNIRFTLESTSNVVLTVSDVLGRPVATLASGKYGAGDHSVTFNAKGLPDGIYRYTLEADGQSVSKCMSLIR